jgi:hypothetical protein
MLPAVCYCLRQPCCLQQLTLHSLFLSEVPDAHLLTALTASTQLRLLSVSEGGHTNAATTLPLPRDALWKMFQPPKQGPFLQVSACAWRVRVLVVNDACLMSAVGSQVLYSTHIDIHTYI